jgi:hypothetical protein
MISNDLINQAENHLRRKHSAGREAELLSKGVPATDFDALNRWVKEARRSNQDELACAGRGVFHACTVRVANGVDSDLPTVNHIGCRVTFVDLAATIDTECEPDEDGSVRWCITWGNVGPGFLEHAYVWDSPNADPDAVLDRHRAFMLKRDDCFATRSEAETAVKKMLEQRAGA